MPLHPALKVLADLRPQEIDRMPRPALLVGHQVAVRRISLEIVDAGHGLGGFAERGMPRNVVDPLPTDVDHAAIAQGLKMLLAGAEHGPSLAARSLARHRHLDDPVGAALVDQQAAVARGAHVADDAGVDVAGGDGPALERLGPGIEADQWVGPHAGLVVPDHAVDHDDRIRMRLRTARRRPFLDLASFRIVAAKPPYAGIDVPDHA